MKDLQEVKSECATPQIKVHESLLSYTAVLKIIGFHHKFSKELLYNPMYLLYLFGNGQVHKKNVKTCQKRIKELEKCVIIKDDENYGLSLELKEMLVSVSERRHVFEAAGESQECTLSHMQRMFRKYL